VWLFPAAIFLGAFLFFDLQLLSTKWILPWFGGAAAVWTTALLFYQALLLCGYAYADGLTRRLSARAQRLVHFGLIVVCVVLVLLCAWRWGSPLTPSVAWRPKDNAHPIGRVLLTLAVAAGPAGLLIASTAPLLQRWVSILAPKRSPYPLYAVSNSGSLAGVIAYPFVFERHLTLTEHALAWGLVFLLFCVLLSAAAFRVREVPFDSVLPEPTREEPTGAWRRSLLWFGLAAAPSMLLSATNNQIGQNVAAIPFLWVLTLGVYLLSFILCFRARPWPRFAAFVPLGLAFPVLGYVLARPFRIPILLQVYLYAFVLLACCLVCHGELARSKPSSEALTRFYLATACGGLSGGAFVALAAPSLFDGIWEFPLAVLLCAFLALTVAHRDRGSFAHRRPLLASLALLIPTVLVPIASGEISWSPAVFAAALIGVALLAARTSPVRPFGSSGSAVWIIAFALAIASSATLFAGVIHDFGRRVIFASRNFYGVLRVTQAPPDEEPSRSLVLGRIPQGFQYWSPKRRREPTGAYLASTGIALTLTHHPRRPAPLSIAVLGLGAGAVAVWGERGDTMRFHEINPAVIRVSAGATPFFTFLADTSARVEIVQADARLSLEGENAAHSDLLDVLVFDVSGGGWIPPHMLTLQAFEIYRKRLRSDGVLALHLSSQFFDYVPLIRRQANELDWPVARVGEWMILARDPAFLRFPEIAAAISPDTAPLASRAWTDDYSSLFALRTR